MISLSKSKNKYNKVTCLRRHKIYKEVVKISNLIININEMKTEN